MDLVLRHLAFRRSPRRAARTLLLVLAAGVSALTAGASLAGPTGPVVVEVRTTDGTGDGYIDALIVTFDTAMDVSVQSPAGFVVEGYELRAPQTQWLCPSGNCSLPVTQLQINLMQRSAVPDGDTAATPAVAYVSQATGGARAAGTGAQLAEGALPVTRDTARPALVRAVGADFGQAGLFNLPADRMDLVFSEPVSLAGATASDRHVALERAIRISNGAGCQAADGDGVQVHNFPRAGSGASAADPILTPAALATSRVISVMMTPDAGALGTTGTNAVSNIPGICKVGVEATGASNIQDAASPANGAASQDVGGTNANRRDITIAPSNLVVVNGVPSIFTRDLLPDPGNGAPKGDGVVDTVELVFDQEILDSSATDALASQFSVTSGAETATVSGVFSTPGDGGPQDASVFLRLSGVSWNGQARPMVSFAPGNACGLRTKIPTPTYYACAAEFGVPNALQAIDKIAPVLTAAQTADADGDGILDRVVLGFSEPIAEASTAAGWTVDGIAASALDVDDTDGRIARLDFTEGSTPNTGAKPGVAYATQSTGGTVDADGNQIGAGSLAATDGAPPVLLAATSFDSDGNGGVDTVTFRFSEVVNQSLAAPAEFTIAGEPATAFATSSIDDGTPADLVTVSTTSQAAGTGQVGAGYAGGALADLASLTVAPKTFAAGEVADKAAPVVTLQTDPVSPFSAGTVIVKAVFSEAMDTDVIPTVEVASAAVNPIADIDHTNGFRNADTTRWDGAIELSEADCAAENGCSLSLTITGGQDVAANVTAAATPVGLALDANPPTAPANEAVEATQKDGYASIAPNTIGSATTQISLSADIVAGEVNLLDAVSGGSAEILRADGLSDEPLEPAALVEDISATATGVTVASAFADPAALQAALPEGTHTLKLRLCDSAGNCATSPGVEVVADYTPVPVTLEAPNSGTLHGKQKTCIQWNADEADGSLVAVTLRYSVDGGVTFPELIAGGLAADGTGACDGSGSAYEWEVPTLTTTTLKVQAATLDSFNNEAADASAENLSVETAFALTHRASASVILNGAPVTFSGVLTGNGDPVEGRPIVIQRMPRGQTAWQSVATVLTGADGTYAWSGRPGSSADWRSVSPAGDGYPTITGATSYVAVRIVINFSQSHTLLSRGQTVTLYGGVVPAYANRVVHLQMYNGGKWIKLAETRTSQYGGYRFTYRLGYPGVRSFRIYYGQQDPGHAGNYSEIRAVRWR